MCGKSRFVIKYGSRKTFLAHVRGAHWESRLRHPSDLSSETKKWFWTHFISTLQGLRKQKIYSQGLGHIINMAATPIHRRILRTLLLQTQWTDCLETCSGGYSVPWKMFRWWSWVGFYFLRKRFDFLSVLFMV